MPELLYFDKRRKKSSSAVDPALIRHLKSFKNFSEKDIREMYPYWNIRKVRKNDFLYQDDLKTPEFGFIFKGSVKLFRKRNDVCQVLALLTDGDLTTITNAFYQEETDYAAICLEPSIIFTITRENMMKLIEERPVFLEFFREQNQCIIRFLTRRFTVLQMMSAHERYDDLNKNYPEIFERFSLQDVANYLGMKAETLSRVRNPSLRKAS